MKQSVKKYKLHMELEREGAKLTIEDTVDKDAFHLNDYIFAHDLEAYNLVSFNLNEIEE